MRVLGVALALGLIAVYLVAIRLILRAPFRALGVLVAGMAFHNFILMVLLRLGTPGVLVRIIQAWKEGIVLLLLLLAGRLAYDRWQSRTRLRLIALDWLVAGFAALAFVYAIVPRFLHGGFTFSQAVIGLRTVMLIPLLYLFGRVFVPRDRHDLRWVAGAILGSAAVVAVFGLIELWFVPTSTWLSWGVSQLSAWLGFTYHGPRGMPENFFQTTEGGYLLRRMVSTYVSPLGVAYTAMLAIPIAAAVLMARWGASRWWALTRWLALALPIISVLLSVTRLAIILVIFELAALAVVYRRARFAIATVLTIAGALFVVFVYGEIGPVVTFYLQPVPIGAARHIPFGGPSTTEHGDALAFDFRYVRSHPLGTGVGSSIHRYGPTNGTGESAIFDMFGDMGLLGGLLYLAIFTLVLVYGARSWRGNRGDPLSAMLPLTVFVGGLALVPITLTTSLWQDFSVTFLFWWAAGASAIVSDRARSVSVAAQPVDQPQRTVA
jgi:hypothetical protein